MMSEDYLKRHKIKNVMLISEGTMAAPRLVTHLEDGHVISVVVPRGMDINDVAKQAAKEVEDYEWEITCKNRKRKLDKLFNKLKE